MKKIIAAFIAMGLSALLLSCEGDISVSMYVQDLLSLTKPGQSIIYTPCTMTTSNISKEEEFAFIQGTFNGVTNGHMVKDDSSEVYSFDVKVPVLAPGTPLSALNEKDFIYFTLNKTDKGYSLSYGYNPAVVDRITKWVSDTYMQTFELKNYAVSIRLDNDSSGDFSFEIQDAYLNGEPYPLPKAATLARRESAAIGIGGILSEAVIARHESLPFLIFK